MGPNRLLEEGPGPPIGVAGRLSPVASLKRHLGPFDRAIGLAFRNVPPEHPAGVLFQGGRNSILPSRFVDEMRSAGSACSADRFRRCRRKAVRGRGAPIGTPAPRSDRLSCGHLIPRPARTGTPRRGSLFIELDRTSGLARRGAMLKSRPHRPLYSSRNRCKSARRTYRRPASFVLGSLTPPRPYRAHLVMVEGWTCLPSSWSGSSLTLERIGMRSPSE